MNALLSTGLAVAALALLPPALVARPAAQEVGQPDGQQDDTNGSQEPAAQAAAEAPPQVTGVVRFEGERPPSKPLKVPVQQAAGCCADGGDVDATDRTLLIAEDGGLANVVVTVTVADVAVEVPDEPYVMDQRRCRFEPHVLVVPKGARVAFLNSDETAHNVHLVTLLNDPLNQTVPAGQTLVREMKDAEAVKVTCDMHTWMSAYVYVTDATHWAVTAADGTFALEGLPPGEHTVKLWHETLGSLSAALIVADDGSAEPLELALEPKKTKSRRRRR